MIKMIFKTHLTHFFNYCVIICIVIIILYKKFVYGNYMFCICFVYIFENSVIQFRIFYKDCFLRWFFKETIYTEFLRNCYGISNNVMITCKIINVTIISK